jgi:excisionase family DNA binding protein
MSAMETFLTIPEVARALRIPPARAYAMARAGELPVTRVGRSVRVYAAALRDWALHGGHRLPGGWRRAPQVAPAEETQ